MATSDVTVTIKDGLRHPYLLALVRWCVSSFWSTATVILHRLITAPIPQIKAPKLSKTRPANYDHLHPEPRVDCEVLHAPPDHTLDVIFVHGLYGSLGNTWRQGEWQSKYDNGPTRIPLRRPHAVPTCKCVDARLKRCSDSKSDQISEENTNSDIVDQNQRRSVDRGNDASDKKVCSVTRNQNDSDVGIKCYSIKNSDEMSEDSGTSERYQSCSDDKNKELINKTVLDLTESRNECRNIKHSGTIEHNNTKCRFEKREQISDAGSSGDVNVQIFPTNIPRSDRIGDVNRENERELNETLYKNIQKILPKENLFITEKFYNNTLLDDVDIGNYETHAQFVKDLFESSVRGKSECECSKVSSSGDSLGQVKADDCKCEVKCEAGCGCVCDDCYSPCWPRDWIRVDYPGARVISINYTSDPYLWRPLWIKESKRLRLHERAEQMISQLLDLGVGQRPIIWVGHSKGGLFIKKIYCEAYEAHLKSAKDGSTKEDTRDLTGEQHTTESRNDNEINHCIDRQTVRTDNANVYTDVNLNELNEVNDRVCESDNIGEDADGVGDEEEGIEESGNDLNGNIPNSEADATSPSKVNEAQLLARASLWHNSAGFMFYSVPHRGSPLADIKTPITARSVELMEICKDCPLVLSLQHSWSVATARAQPPVRSLVETCRTLMSILYLRIVSVDSADPGIGALNGVDVDHREICKPSSRKCMLYRELMTLMETALTKQ